MRIISSFNHTYDNALRAAIHSIIVRKYFNELGYPLTIKKRENSAGITLTKEISELNDIGINGHLINQTVKSLMLEHEVTTKDFEKVIEMMNSYSTIIIESDNYKPIKIPHIMSGRLPYDRIKAINYAISVLPFHQQKSVFEYYAKKKESNKRFEKMSTLQWCMEILKAIDFQESNEVFEIPFEYDLRKEEDRNKILDYYQNGSSIAKESNMQREVSDNLSHNENDDSPKERKN